MFVYMYACIYIYIYNICVISTIICNFVVRISCLIFDLTGIINGDLIPVTRITNDSYGIELMRSQYMDFFGNPFTHIYIYTHLIV